jgi:hypothetical protein
MVAFLTAAVGVVTVAPRWKGLAGGAALLSLQLCLASWNDAKAGVVIDLLILVGLGDRDLGPATRSGLTGGWLGSSRRASG